MQGDWLALIDRERVHDDVEHEHFIIGRFCTVVQQLILYMDMDGAIAEGVAY
jgi:hypothetical protein